jgi:hypothetical protein
MKDALIITVFVAFLATGILEAVSAVIWWSWFYRAGPRLWKREVRANATVFQGGAELAIAGATNSRFWRPIVFRRLSDREVAFRESLMSFRPAMGISGLIKEDPAAGVLTITTRSWFLVLGLALAVAGALAEGNVGSALVGIVLAGLLAAQYRRLGAMSRAVQTRVV